MPIAGRHIRHDWQTFVDWKQVSVRTVCGKTSKQHLAGVPGVTEQPLVVSAGPSKTLSGWCIRCAHTVNRQARDILVDNELTEDIKSRYIKAVMATERAFQTYIARQELLRQERLDRQAARV